MKTTASHLLRTTAFAAFAAIVTLFVACNEDPGFHRTEFIYPNAQVNPYYYGYKPIYADQPLDSVFFATTERWHLYLEYSNAQKDWCTVLTSDIIEPDFKMLENSLYYMGGYVQFLPNTSGHKRSVRLVVSAGEYTCSGGFVQLPYLCITRPFRYVITDEIHSPLTSRDSLSSLVALANTPFDSIVFTVHSDWELSVRTGSWLKPAVTEGGAGDQSVRVNYDANLTNRERRDTIFLKTRGLNNTTDELIIDTIPFIQRASE